MSGDEAELLVRHRGEPLKALQHVVDMAYGRGLPGEQRVFVDALEYRKGKDVELRQMARLLAEKAQQTGIDQQLGPLNPYERRIVHLAVAEVPGRDDGKHRRRIFEDRSHLETEVDHRPTEDTKTFVVFVILVVQGLWFMFSTSDTIVAIATPPGRGGLGVVRLSGPEAHRIARGLIARDRDLEPRHATFCLVRLKPAPSSDPSPRARRAASRFSRRQRSTPSIRWSRPTSLVPPPTPATMSWS